MRINYNVSAMLANNALANNDDLLSKSLERLSSGLKVNHAKDNPAGLAMAKRMNAQIVGVNVANQNASDGISIIETADGALAEVSDMLQRMNELAVKAANGTMSDSDRETIQEEIVQLKEEITRVSNTTEFNGQKLLDGEFSYKGYTDNTSIKVNSYSETAAGAEYSITNLVLTKELDANGNPATDPHGNELYSAKLKIAYKDGDTIDAKTSVQDDLLTIKNSEGFELVLDLSAVDMTGVDSKNIGSLNVDALGVGPMRLQVGANEGQVLAVNIPAVTLKNMGIERIDVSTAAGAEDAIERLDGAIKYVSGVRGKLGAYQNRLESTTNSLDVTEENMTAAYSRLMDVDMAEEMTEYTTSQVLTQAGTSMLAQANERPSQVLQLLQ